MLATALSILRFQNVCFPSKNAKIGEFLSLRPAVRVKFPTLQ